MLSMLPKQLRDLSRLYREAARKADAETKQQLAAHAATLAQVAEARERMIAARQVDASQRDAIERHKTALALALSDKVRQTVRTLLAGPPAHGHGPSQIRAWRLRAEELRTTADEFRVPTAQEALRRAAANYEQLADNAEALLEQRPAPGQEKTG